MKRVLHLCHSSEDEVMCRDENDYIRAFNSFALALDKTESKSLADAQMSNHRHYIVNTSEPERLMRLSRVSYTKHFNSKYKRKGALGAQDFFTLEIEGLHHLIAAISYVNRNSLHHGVTATPFGYPFSSANSIFTKDLGRHEDIELLPKKSFHNFTGRNTKIPEGFVMDKNGMILRQNIMDIKQVELIYVTAKGYLYYMNRPTDERWKKEQEEDNNGAPAITPDIIERGTHLTSDLMLINNEKGRSDYKRISDIQLCKEIDKIVVSHFKQDSIYQLSYSQRHELYHMIRSLYNVDEKQAQRCTALNYSQII